MKHSGVVRVLHIADKFGVRGSSVHGVTRLFSWWMPRFDSARYDAKLVGLRPPDAACAALEQTGIKVISLSKGKFNVSTVPAIVSLIRKERAQIIHLHGYGAANFGRVAARITGVKVVVHEHFVDPAMPAYQGPCDYLLRRWTDYGIAVSGSTKEFMVKKRHLPETKVEVVFNGAPLRDFAPVTGPALDAERRKWGLRDDDVVVGSIGRLDEQKGNRYLLEAVASIRPRWPRLKLLIVGDGPYLENLKAQSQELGIASDVVFTGFQSQIPLLQSLLHIQAFPSLWEGTPLTVFEAMAMRRTIVSTAVDGLGEVLRDNHDARLVPSRDAARLADAIEDLLAHPETAVRLAKEAGISSQRFDIQRTVDRMEEIYEEILHP
jgi:glycosyltransferase involved in cell wall biosynthesis